MRQRLSYANVVATLALFVSLGGASYAALAPPRDSVGPAQLRAGAVRARALGVAAGTASVSDQTGHRYVDFRRNCRPGADGIVPPCAPRPYAPITRLRLRTRAAGTLLVSALTSMTDIGPASDSARVNLTATVDGKQLPGQSSQDVPAGRTVEAPYQSSVRVPAGRHEVALLIVPSNFAGELRVEPVTLSAVSLPPA